MDIRVLDLWNDQIELINDWLPADSVDASGRATVTLRWPAGPGELLPISEDTGDFLRQVVEADSVLIDIKDDLVDWLVSQVDVDEAGVLAVMGAADRASLDAWAACQTLEAVDTSSQTVWIRRAVVEDSWEKLYPDAVNRKTLDIPALALQEKGRSLTDLKNDYSLVPTPDGITWPEFAAAFHVNLAAVSRDKDTALEAARIYINNNY